MLAQPQLFLFPEIIKPWEHKKMASFHRKMKNPCSKWDHSEETESTLAYATPCKQRDDKLVLDPWTQGLWRQGLMCQTHRNGHVTIGVLLGTGRGWSDSWETGEQCAPSSHNVLHPDEPSSSTLALLQRPWKITFLQSTAMAVPFIYVF